MDPAPRVQRLLRTADLAPTRYLVTLEWVNADSTRGELSSELSFTA